jgi:CHAD domain-containing protein
MNRKQIENIIRLFFLRLKKLYSQVEKNPDTASIKPFRIQIKKIRAFLRLLRLEPASHGELRLPKPLKKRYQSGGDLQDIGILEIRIEKAKATHPGNQYDTSHLFDDARKKYAKIKRTFLSDEEYSGSESGILKEIPSKCSISTVKRFLREKINSILYIVEGGNLTDKKLHKMRKILKDILYTLKLYREDLRKPLGFAFWSPRERDMAVRTEEWLGAYNDNRNSIKLLSLKRIRKMKKKEMELLLEVRKQLFLERRNLKKLILKGLAEINYGKP